MQQAKSPIGSKSQLKVTKATLQSVKDEQEICCRICLQEMPQSETFTVCSCKGPNGHVHEKCLMQWAKKAQKYRESFDTYYYHCQICKQKILLEVNTRVTCLKYRQIYFCGEEFCCTISSLIILILGIGMFIVGLAFKLTTDNSDMSFLFNLTLGISATIVVIDIVLAFLYFILYTEITVIGILISDEDKKKRHKAKLPIEPKIQNSHQIDQQKPSLKNVKDRNLNETEMFFMEEGLENFRDQRLPTINNLEEGQNETSPAQRILFPQINNNNQTKQDQLSHKEQNQQNQAQKQNQSARIQYNHPETNITPQPINKTSLQITQTQNPNSFSQPNNHPQQPNNNNSTSSIQEAETHSIKVKNIKCKSKSDYKNNLSNNSVEAKNEVDSSMSQVECQINHNQIIPQPNSVYLNRPYHSLPRYRNTLGEKMTKSGYEVDVKQPRRTHVIKQSLDIGESSDGQESRQEPNKVEIYFPTLNKCNESSKVCNIQNLNDPELQQ